MAGKPRLDGAATVTVILDRPSLEIVDAVVERRGGGRSDAIRLLIKGEELELRARRVPKGPLDWAKTPQVARRILPLVESAYGPQSRLQGSGRVQLPRMLVEARRRCASDEELLALVREAAAVKA